MHSQTISRGAQVWTQSYSYTDGLNRLTGASESGAGAWSRSYGHDAWANRWVSANSGVPISSFTPTVSTNFDASNRLNIQNAMYDGSGNQTQIGGFAETYDGENRLQQNTVNGVTTQYGYDGEGRRVTKTVGTQTTVYVYDVTGQLAAEYGAASDSGTRFVTGDALGSTRLVTDAGGHAYRCYDYLPYGEEIPAGTAGRTGTCFGAATYPATGPDVVSDKFTGKQRDWETGLDYFGARYFSAAQGRFTSPDWSAVPQPVPYANLSDPQTLNLYTYVRNNPLSKVDPDGHCGIWGDSSCSFTQWVSSIPDRVVGGLKFEANAALEIVGIAPKFQPSNAEQADAMDAGEQVKPLFQTGLAMAIPGPEGIKGEVVEPEVAPNFDAARTTAFEKAGMTNPADVQFSKVDPKTGTVVEFKGPNGAKVAYDPPHDAPGPGHDQPHVGWQTGGKRGAGGTERGNIPYKGPQHPSRPKVKGEGDITQE